MSASVRCIKRTPLIKLIGFSSARKQKANPTAPTRRLILVDVENVCGKGELSCGDVKMAKQEVIEKLHPTDEDLVVIGTSHKMNLLACGTEWRGPRQVLIEGHDGADRALIEAVKDYRLDTFASVVLVSGDGIFADITLKMRAMQTRVIVAAEKIRLSGKLANVASAIRYIKEDAPIAA